MSRENNTPHFPSFFRTEVIASKNQLSLGTIRIAQSASSMFVSCIALALAGTLIAYVYFGSITKKAHISGIIVPSGGSISIVAPSAGIVSQKLVIDGQNILKGQALFEISTARQNDGGEITELIAEQLSNRKLILENERRLRSAAIVERTQALSEKRANLAAEIVQLQQETFLAERRSELIQNTFSKYQVLKADGYVSDAQLKQKQEEVIDSMEHLSDLKRIKLQIQENIIGLDSEQKTLSNTLATEQAQLDGSLANLQQEIAENKNRKTSIILASEAGVVTGITLQQGQAVTAGQVIATVLTLSKEKSQPEVHLYAPSRTVGFLGVGQRVLIRLQAFPYEKYGFQFGTVIDVSDIPFSPNELPEKFASTILGNAQKNTQEFNVNEAMYRIKVKLDKQGIKTYGKNRPFKPGMTLDADVIEDNRRIWEWLIDPVLAVVKK